VRRSAASQQGLEGLSFIIEQPLLLRLRVHPVDDFGSDAVCSEGHCEPIPNCRASADSVITMAGIGFLLPLYGDSCHSHIAHQHRAIQRCQCFAT
jgi:hypothetical protein